MPPSMDMSPILEALAARRSGGLGGGGMPPAAQMTGAGAAPQPPAPVPQGNPADMPQQVKTTSAAMKASQTAQGPQFDPETRDLAKALIQKLLKGV